MRPTTNSSNVRGIYRDVLIEPDCGVVCDTGWRSNTIVEGCRVLIAGLMSGVRGGIKYLAVGQGNPDWDDGTIDDIDPTAKSLWDHDAKKIELEPAHFAYLVDDVSLRSTQSPTPRLYITVKIPPEFHAAGTLALREFGLIGLLGEEEYMINCIRHPVIHKGPNATLIRNVRLCF